MKAKGGRKSGLGWEESRVDASLRAEGSAATGRGCDQSDGMINDEIRLGFLHVRFLYAVVVQGASLFVFLSSVVPRGNDGNLFASHRIATFENSGRWSVSSPRRNSRSFSIAGARLFHLQLHS